MKVDKSEPLYVISIASEILKMHPQTLRLYERLGLVKPRRSKGMTRLYSEEDIKRIRKIHHLTQDLGVNLAGVDVILNILEKMDNMRREMEEEIERIRKAFSQGEI